MKEEEEEEEDEEEEEEEAPQFKMFWRGSKLWNKKNFVQGPAEQDGTSSFLLPPHPCCCSSIMDMPEQRREGREGGGE